MAKVRTDDTDGSRNTSRKRGKVGTGYDAPFKGYINLDLTVAQKESFPGWFSSASFPDTLDSNVADGVNLSLKWEPKKECFLASATQRREDSPNAGLVVTARADEPLKALGRVCFCLAVLGHKDRWEDTQPIANPDRW